MSTAARRQGPRTACRFIDVKPPSTARRPVTAVYVGTRAVKSSTSRPILDGQVAWDEHRAGALNEAKSGGWRSSPRGDKAERLASTAVAIRDHVELEGESSLVVASSGAGPVPGSPDGPAQAVVGVAGRADDEGVEQAADLVDGPADQGVVGSDVAERVRRCGGGLRVPLGELPSDGAGRGACGEGDTSEHNNGPNSSTNAPVRPFPPAPVLGPRACAVARSPGDGTQAARGRVMVGVGQGAGCGR
jgi:hypothetical protein